MRRRRFQHDARRSSLAPSRILIAFPLLLLVCAYVFVLYRSHELFSTAATAANRNNGNPHHHQDERNAPFAETEEASNIELDGKVYWRYDLVGPTILRGLAMELPSIPSQHRLTLTATQNVTDFFSTPENVYPTRQYLFDYNPSIVPLPKLHRNQTLSVGDQEHKKPTYVASFRVSNQNYCFHPHERKMMVAGQQPKDQDYLGLALLSSDFEILADGVVDVKGVKVLPGAQDFRLFVSQTNEEVVAQVYLTSNDLIVPLWIDSWTPAPPPNAVALPNVFGSLRAWVRPFASCAPCGKQRGVCGKNFNYFALTHDSGRAMVEVWPSPPHLVRPIDLTQPCQRSSLPEQQQESAAGSSSSEISPMPSFQTAELALFPQIGANMLTRGRGGACCVPLEHTDASGQTQMLWMGVEHSKTPSQRHGNKRLPDQVQANHYLSRLYAFERLPPHRLVARSGYFCLGFPSEHEEYHHVHNNQPPLVRVTAWRELELGDNATFNCPRIHFISGMTLDALDPSRVWLTYGVNDCLSRFVQIRLLELKQLLLVGPTKS